MNRHPTAQGRSRVKAWSSWSFAFPRRVAAKLAAAEQSGVLTGTIRVSTELTDARRDVPLVVECGPENLEIKQRIFVDVEAAVPTEAVLTTVSSSIPISQSAGTLETRGPARVAHPGQPAAPHPRHRAGPRRLRGGGRPGAGARRVRRGGDDPRRPGGRDRGLRRESPAGAVLREAMHLVGEGIVGPDDVDAVIRDALAPRWVVAGSRDGGPQHPRRLRGARAHDRGGVCALRSRARRPERVGP